MVQAWRMAETVADQRAENRAEPNVDVSIDQLGALGVMYMQLDGQEGPQFEQLKAAYDYCDWITINAESLPNYEEKVSPLAKIVQSENQQQVKTFFEEHLHPDDEVRYILDGTGYFDVRDRENKWIRVKVEKGDYLVIPSGIYHRFTVDTNDYIKATRLFKGVPVWTPYNRTNAETETMKARKDYLKTFI